MLNAQNIPLCLSALGLAGEDFGPVTDTYAGLAQHWRGSVPVPSEADLLVVLPAVEAEQGALTAIAALESQVTQRRIREAVTTQAGADWLADIEAQIAVHRAALSGN
jgi:hypothetical protein